MFGQELAKNALKIAQKMGNNRSLGKCALAVGDALSATVGEDIARKFRGNAYQWLPKLKQDLGKKYWTYLRQSKDTTNLPAGSIVLWDKQPAHPYGHIEIADGYGHLISDFIRSDKLALYISNPANIVPQIFVPVEQKVEIKNALLPFDVKVTATTLNIRTNPVNGAIVDKVENGTIMTVWAMQTVGNSQWGKNSKGFFCMVEEGKEYVSMV